MGTRQEMRQKSSNWARIGLTSVQASGTKERIEKDIVMLVERAACSRSCGVSWRGRLWPDWELSLDLTPVPKARKAACKWEGNMIRFVF